MCVSPLRNIHVLFSVSLCCCFMKYSPFSHLRVITLNEQAWNINFGVATSLTSYPFPVLHIFHPRLFFSERHIKSNAAKKHCQKLVTMESSAFFPCAQCMNTNCVPRQFVIYCLPMHYLSEMNNMLLCWHEFLWVAGFLGLLLRYKRRRKGGEGGTPFCVPHINLAHHYALCISGRTAIHCVACFSVISVSTQMFWDVILLTQPFIPGLLKLTSQNEVICWDACFDLVISNYHSHALIKHHDNPFYLDPMAMACHGCRHSSVNKTQVEKKCEIVLRFSRKRIILIMRYLLPERPVKNPNWILRKILFSTVLSLPSRKLHCHLQELESCQ